jgi:hypothetical protein
MECGSAKKEGWTLLSFGPLVLSTGLGRRQAQQPREGHVARTGFAFSAAALRIPFGPWMQELATAQSIR